MNVLDFLVVEAVQTGATDFAQIYHHVVDCCGVIHDDIGSAERVKRSVWRMSSVSRITKTNGKWEAV
jgi:hypothetical protein